MLFVRAPTTLLPLVGQLVTRCIRLHIYTTRITHPPLLKLTQRACSAMPVLFYVYHCICFDLYSPSVSNPALLRPFPAPPAPIVSHRLFCVLKRRYGPSGRPPHRVYSVHEWRR